MALARREGRGRPASHSFSEGWCTACTGGQPMRYKSREYSASVSINLNPQALYRPKPWVPNWLWEILSEPDLLSLVRARMHDAKAALETQIEDTLRRTP